MELESFKTIEKPSEEILFKDRKSKFYGYAFPVSTEDDIKSLLESLRKKHPNANHVCYAWQLGIEQPKYRANDDGEPNNSAGAPIHGQIQAFELTNVLVAVVRFFGGTKLGVGGLIQAYRETAGLSLQNSVIVEKTLTKEYKLAFEYNQMDSVMTVLKKTNATILEQKMEMSCSFTVRVPNKIKERFLASFEALHKVTINPIS